MADLAPEKLSDALALSKVAQQLLLIQTQQANHVANLEKQIANLRDEIKLKTTEVETRDAQISSLQLELELEKLKQDQARILRRPVIVRLPRGPPNPSSLPSSLASSQRAHIHTKSASDIFNDKYDPIEAPKSLFEGITTEAGGRSGSRIGGQSRTGPSTAVALGFQDIPYQIQRKIWRYSMPAPQVLELCKVQQGQSQQTRGGDAIAAPLKYMLIGDLPAAFHTHQLSRVEILRAYSRLARGKTTQNDEALIKRADSVDSYADFKRDTVYISGMGSGTIEELHQALESWPLFKNVQYLAVEMGVWNLLVGRRLTLRMLLLRAKSLQEIAIVLGEERSVPQAKLGKPMLLVDCYQEDHEKRRSMEGTISAILLGSGVEPPKIRLCRLRRRPAASVIRDTTPTLTSKLATPSLVQKPDHATGHLAAESNARDHQPFVASTIEDFDFSFAAQVGTPLFGPLSFGPRSFGPRSSGPASGVAGAEEFRSGYSRVRKAYIGDGNQVPRFAPIPSPQASPFIFGLDQPKAE